MKEIKPNIIVVDVETTGLNPEVNHIVSIGAVDLFNPDRLFYEECRIPDGALVSPQAMIVNGRSMESLIEKTKPSEMDILSRFLEFAALNDTVYVLAGSNPTFDLGFLKATAKRYGYRAWRVPHHAVDLFSLTVACCLAHGETRWMDIHKTDDCLVYVGMPPEPKPHLAYQGAMLEAEALWRIIKGKCLFPEYACYPVPIHLGMANGSSLRILSGIVKSIFNGGSV